MQPKSKHTFRNIILVLFCAILALVGWFWYDANVDRSGWQETRDGVIYRDFHGKPVSGWQEIDGQAYYFGDDQLRATHWLNLNGNTYYLGSDGARVSGWQEIDGKSYCFSSEGAMFTGWADRDGKICYLGEDGTPFSGWLEDGESVYYLDDSGFPMTGLMTIDDSTYLFSPNGTMATGWQNMEDGTRYFHDTGKMATGFTEIGEDTFCFAEDGTQILGWFTQGEYSYYFHEDGTMAVGPTQIEGKQYHFSPHGVKIVLVNPWNTLPEDLEIELVELGNWQYVDKTCADALNRMLDACREAGHYPYVCSSYRTQEDQEYLMENKIRRLVLEEGYSWEEAPEVAKQSVAVPGTSEHQLGLAVDIVADGYYVLDYTQAKTETQAWLMENCWDYGFILRYPDNTTDITGIIYEPWHYRYVGVEVALELKELGITLEEYLDAVVTE